MMVIPYELTVNAREKSEQNVCTTYPSLLVSLFAQCRTIAPLGLGEIPVSPHSVAAHCCTFSVAHRESPQGAKGRP